VLQALREAEPELAAAADLEATTYARSAD